MEYFKKDSNPLFRVEEQEIPLGDFVYDNFGRCLQKVNVDGKALLLPRRQSVLVETILVSDLDNEMSIDLFWKLSRTKLKDGN